MPKLNQIIAVASGKKSKVESVVTKLYHHLQQPAQFAGLEKTYEPKDDEGEVYPPDSKRLQLRCEDLMTDAADAWAELFDVVLTQEASNCGAFADVTVDGKVLLGSVPVTYLLFLEKRLVDVRTFIGKLPTLDPARDWKYSNEASAYVTEPVKRTKTKKVVRHDVVVQATEQHPAQVVQYHEDVVEGHWVQTDLSGAVSESRKRELTRRVDALIDAVKKAREEANGIDVTPQKAGQQVFDYLFGVQTQA